MCKILSNLAVISGILRAGIVCPQLNSLVAELV